MAKSRLDQLRQDARKEIAAVVERLEKGDLPVDLKTLAKAEGVGAIRFRPILGTAGLLKVDDGFDIVVNTEAPGANQPSDTVYDVNDSNWSDLPGSIRFTVAHEIVHLVLLRLSGGDPNKDIFFRNEEALDHLSNELASSLLLPTNRLVEEIGKELFSAGHLAHVATMFRVSPEALARRLHSADVRKQFTDAEGLAGYVREERAVEGSIGTFRFIAGEIWGVPARHQFGIGGKGKAELFDSSEFPVGHALRDMRLDADISDVLRAETRGRRSANAVWREGVPRKILRCEVQFHRTSETPLGCLLTIRVVEGPIEG